MEAKPWYEHRVEESQQWLIDEFGRRSALCLPLSDRLVGLVWHRTYHEPPEAVFSGMSAAVLALSRNLQVELGIA
jgi:hypothetical protein